MTKLNMQELYDDLAKAYNKHVKPGDTAIEPLRLLSFFYGVQMGLAFDEGYRPIVAADCAPHIQAGYQTGRQSIGMHHADNMLDKLVKDRKI